MLKPPPNLGHRDFDLHRFGVAFSRIGRAPFAMAAGTRSAPGFGALGDVDIGWVGRPSLAQAPAAQP
ncbi:hypothetical protein [Nonomuraea jiangxiensis]|uniref:Uncharacterized protein n=1 Tax=Nonomuraea jiangxiensis TaxID=633440 RepID=A0A1G9SQF9_9ACTN|nr:hypothetical protein [Nonomuraea jiangxiensis]SDM37689.1 hypothetical protein SAMN05421869_14233 [Nonomuraea jiangxiensis]